MQLKPLLFGSLFGFVLARSGATSYDVLTGLFDLSDLTILLVMSTAIVGLAVAFAVLRRRLPVRRSGEPLALKPKPMTAGIVPGGLLFGAGWALAGACPGTVLAQLGEGSLLAGVTIAGLLAGTVLHRVAAEAWSRPRAPGLADRAA